jgi:hypothetical protein
MPSGKLPLIFTSMTSVEGAIQTGWVRTQAGRTQQEFGRYMG